MDQGVGLADAAAGDLAVDRGRSNTAGLALILVAFGYCYRPVAWLRTLVPVVAAVALAVGRGGSSGASRGPRLPSPAHRRHRARGEEVGVRSQKH